ncbi:MAG: PrpR N-terminal domain-containing protein [Faecousia sp.]
MNERIRVLGIAPYENMKRVMGELACEYPQMELTIFVGDREAGLEIARQNFHGNYDVVISRGATAAMLKKELPLPVVEIEISTYDLLCALRLAGGLEKRVAMVCAENISVGAHRLRDLMDLDMDIFTYDCAASLRHTISQLDRNEYDALLCDMVAFTTAKTMGLNAFLITSSVDNIRKAFDQAAFLSRSQAQLRRENQFLRELLQWQIGYTIILDDSGSLYLSTADPVSPELMDMLRRELPECIQTPERKISRSLGGTLYMIRTKRIHVGPTAYTAFFYDIRKTPLSSGHMGIRTFTRPEAEERYCRGVFSTSGFPTDAEEEIEKIEKNAAPVMIVGEDGTGKESAADILFLHSQLRNNPLIHINCATLGEKGWDFLLEHHNSPLADKDSTLYFINADTLPMDRVRQLLSVLIEMRVCSRNRVFFSCVCPKGESVSQAANAIIDNLCCMTLQLPSLRELSDRIPMMVNMYLSRVNEDVSRQILGVEPQAMELLQQYPWPNNYAQFRRVMMELAATASGQFITAQEVRALLRKERYVGSFTPHAENDAIPLDLSRPLEEINRDIVRRVVEETGGNQTLAAKRLGISRTTLWRMIQK